jgi:sulfhydrogenase subunit gamma (sulfur reductase)
MKSMAVEKQDIYSPLMAKIINVEQLTKLEKRFEIVLPDNQILNHKPGQFVEVSLFGYGEAPISICSSPTKIPAFELSVRKVGRLTEKMNQLSAGSAIGIRGPFGNGFDLDRFKGKDILFVCGGIGLFPLKSLIDYTIAKRKEFGRLIILYGSKNPAEISFKNDIKMWEESNDLEFHITVDYPDDKWKGNVGVITTLIPPLTLNEDNTLVAVVGPPVMYKFVIMSLKTKRIPDENIYLSLERRMKCGVGKCGHCQINNKYVCQDGPVFQYSQLKSMEEAL